ncbi:hypothetical protein M231_03961 [Tremella mesenterica]|uniref:FHA domain-containing protein n=1 Tax=Tremella mesenterica TaxID=5217 RepID=A0A4Q1BLV0_TREME|nr:hypothetical protein M231_03961 [Tremella mesenterica]
MSATPLSHAKLVSVPTPSTPSTLKRPPPSHTPLDGFKRLKPTPITPSALDSRSMIKTSFPTHLGPLTPTTSTVAFSSPPKLASSSPVRIQPTSPIRSLLPPRIRRKNQSSFLKAYTPPMEVSLFPGQTLIFGRHRHSSTSKSSTTLSASIPSTMIDILHGQNNQVLVMDLPRQATHASRVHAAVEKLQDGEGMRILVVGQNGLRVITGGRTKRVLRGEKVDIYGDEVELDFYGCVVKVTMLKEKRETSSLTPISSSPTRRSLPPSSPPMMTLDLPEDESHEDEPSSRASTPLSEAEDESTSARKPTLQTMEMGPDNEVVEKEQTVEVKREKIFSVLNEKVVVNESSSLSPPPPSGVPEGVDLAAVLATTVVFSGSSKLSLPDLVKHMLESQPSLKTHGDEEIWAVWCAAELENNPMFGKVQRSGKDSSGRPLLAHYFYIPDRDLDTARATQLGGLVRPLRTVQRAGGKAIDWRPVGGGKRRL